MNPKTVQAAIDAAQAFIERANIVRSADSQRSVHYFTDVSPALTGALRRSSMELTRALAAMRKPS